MFKAPSFDDFERASLERIDIQFARAVILFECRDATRTRLGEDDTVCSAQFVVVIMTVRNQSDAMFLANFEEFLAIFEISERFAQTRRNAIEVVMEDDDWGAHGDVGKGEHAVEIVELAIADLAPRHKPRARIGGIESHDGDVAHEIDKRPIGIDADIDIARAKRVNHALKSSICEAFARVKIVIARHNRHLHRAIIFPEHLPDGTELGGEREVRQIARDDDVFTPLRLERLERGPRGLLGVFPRTTDEQIKPARKALVEKIPRTRASQIEPVNVANMTDFHVNSSRGYVHRRG